MQKTSTKISLAALYTIICIVGGVFLRMKFEPAPTVCPAVSIASTEQFDQGHKEKGVDHYEENVKLPDGTEIKRKGTKEFSVEDYLKGFKSVVKTVQLPAPEPDNFSFEVNFKDIEKFPELKLKNAEIGIRVTDHFWGLYQKDFENADNVVGVRYTTKVNLWPFR